MAVDAGYAEWLQSSERLSEAANVLVTTKWGALAGEQRASSAIATASDADLESARQLAFVGGPIVEERVTFPTAISISQLRGRVIIAQLAGDPTYAGGVAVFVLGGDVDHANGTSRLDVLRRL